MNFDNDLVNIVVWACTGALGIVCSYYGSHYLAKGTVYVCNDYLNLNLDQKGMQFLIFGSLCLGVVSVCFPHIADSFANIIFTVDMTPLYGHLSEVGMINMCEEQISNHVLNINRMDLISDINNLENWHCVSKYLNPDIIYGSVEYNAINAINVALLNKLYCSSIMLPNFFYEAIAEGSFLFEKYYEPFSNEVLVANYDNLRLYNLYYLATLTEVADYSVQAKALLAHMNLGIVRNDLILALPEYMVKECLSEGIVASLQLIEALHHLGLAPESITQFEFYLRGIVNNELLTNFSDEIVRITDGSDINLVNKLIDSKRIMKLYSYITTDPDWVVEILTGAYEMALEEIIDEVN